MGDESNRNGTVPMNATSLKRIWMLRETRVAALCAALAILALVAASSGHWLLASILGAGAAAAAAALYLFAIRPTRIPRDAVLTLKIAGAIAEEQRRAPFDQLLGRVRPSLCQIRAALEAAREDPRLRAVIVEIAGFQNGLATAEELHELIAAVRDSGKRVVAVLKGDLATARDYLVAAGASEVVVNPDTIIAMLGVAARGVFLKGALDKLNIQVQALQWKEYKGAGEMLTRERMSAALRESLEALVGDWRDALSARVAAARRTDAARAQELVGAGFLSASDALKAGLADREGYVEDIRTEFAPEGKRRNLVGLGRYLRRIARLSERRGGHRIALVCGVGPVISGESPMAGEFLSGDTAAAQIERASRDKAVRAIVFRVNSPGGSAVASDLIWRAVRAAQGRGKPVVVSMGDVAGSGGYYVAAGADAIVAEPSTVTGSIGVVYAKFDLSRVLEQAGVGVEAVKSDTVSDALSSSRSMSEGELRQLDGVLAQLYANFTGKVAEGRRLTAEAAEAVARGRVWSGQAAKAHGLVDELGGLGRAVALALEKALIPAAEPYHLVSYSQPGFVSSLRLALAGSEPGFVPEAVAHGLGIPVRWMPAMARLMLRGGAMLLGPTIDL
jgi:protease IV